ncbi:CAP domain-containing protein, partial [Gottschalkia purinilytica]|uniref:CAP domain-containing protein n=1 Tax=Gottschalkia purinilytica TaxID=1503 RepID=UPI00067BA93F
RPSDNNNKPSDNNNKPSDNNNKPSDNNNKPSDNNNKPSDNNNKPSDNNNKPSDNNNKPSDNNNKPSDNNNKPSDNNNKPSDNNNKPSDNNNKPSDNNNKPSNVSQFESEVVRLVNIERNKAGLAPLTMDSELSKIARVKSQDMADKNYFSHTSPTYGSPFDMLKKFGVSYRTAGENIAKGYSSPESVVKGWMNSEGHRANILSSNFGKIGVGYVNQGGTTYWTQLFTN